MQVNILEAKTQLSSLIARAVQGDEIVIAKRGKPVAKLTAIEAPAKRVLGFLDMPSIPDSAFDPMTEEELKEAGLA
ncbi:MAG: type II toxin-antitoxin system prevent-host-death family antitoxin [Coriobacteriia bacterium]|nr:type II toxin-antitoxin system prevent-host-death family antitoxin [Coriobacteriia bacterium]